jgi:amidophosphoribosyltransferase
VQLLRDAGASEVHLGISSPPFKWPCYLGLDVAKRDELIAARLESVEEIGREIGADSIRYLSLEGLIKAIDLPHEAFCVGCFTGHYPMPVQMDLADKLALEPKLSLANTLPAATDDAERRDVVGLGR